MRVGWTGPRIVLAMETACHRVVEEWMGVPVTTLEDLLRLSLHAVCIGINPAPRSVDAGHYYQGQLGRKLFDQLRQVGVLSAGRSGWEDDEAFAAGIGFTDIVKRPTARAADVSAEEFAFGRGLLFAKLSEHRPRLAIFTFKQTARILFGDFSGNGFVRRLRLDGTDVFIMPRPYENAASATATLSELADYLRGTGGS